MHFIYTMQLMPINLKEGLQAIYRLIKSALHNLVTLSNNESYIKEQQHLINIQSQEVYHGNFKKTNRISSYFTF